MIMPGVQYPHCRPWFSWNACWSGCIPSSPAMPSIVVISRPSAWTASIVQDLTDLPSTRTVHEPHVEVSHPTFVPVRPRCSRRKYTSSVRGSTSPSRGFPFTVKDTCLKGASSRLPRDR